MNTSGLRDDGLMTVQQFLDWANIGRTRFYDEINTGRLIAVKLGNKTLVRKNDARAWRDNLPMEEPKSRA